MEALAHEHRMPANRLSEREFADSRHCLFAGERVEVGFQPCETRVPRNRLEVPSLAVEFLPPCHDGLTFGFRALSPFELVEWNRLVQAVVAVVLEDAEFRPPILARELLPERIPSGGNDVMPPVAARFERPIVLPVGEGFDLDAGLGERLVGLTAPFRLVAFSDEPLVRPFEVGGPCELALHVGVGFEFGELVQLVECQLAEIGGHVARLLRDAGDPQPSAHEPVAASRLLGHLLDVHA